SEDPARRSGNPPVPREPASPDSEQSSGTCSPPAMHEGHSAVPDSPVERQPPPIPRASSGGLFFLETNCHSRLPQPAMSSGLRAPATQLLKRPPPWPAETPAPAVLPSDALTTLRRSKTRESSATIERRLVPPGPIRRSPPRALQPFQQTKRFVPLPAPSTDIETELSEQAPSMLRDRRRWLAKLVHATRLGP